MKISSSTSYFILLFFGVISSKTKSPKRYTDGLIKYLKEESKLHQVMFILDKQLSKSQPKVNSIFQGICDQFPFVSITFNESETKLKNNYLPLLLSPKKTTLFVLILEKNDKTSFDLIAKTAILLKLIKLTDSTPKSLIVYLHSKRGNLKSHQSLLSTLWKNNFLDITLITYITERNELLKAEEEVSPLVHHFNPFINKYDVELVSFCSKWFPYKLKNLNKQKLKFLYFLRNNQSSKNPIQQGQKMAQLLGHVMNFHPEIEVLILKDPPVYNFVEKRNAAMCLNVMALFNVRPGHILSNRICRISSIKAVIPRITKLTKVIVVSQEFIYMVLVTIALMSFIRLVALLLRFKEDTWQVFSISQLIMGMGVVNEPKKLVERIIFGSLLIACIVYTGYFFTVILDFTFVTEQEISNLKELSRSSLTPMLIPQTKQAMQSSSISYIRELARSSIQIPDLGSFDCLRYLAAHQNVSCFISNAPEVVKEYILKESELNVIILPETVTIFLDTFISRPGSPFTDSFDKIIQKSIEFGLIPFFIDNKLSLYNVLPPETIEKKKLLLIMFSVLFVGFFFAIIVLLVEFCTFAFRKWKAFG